MGGSNLDVSNYRRVSVLRTIRKVLEKLMLTRLTKYLHKSKIIYEHKFFSRKTDQQHWQS